jgi:hypothetical protein
MMNGLKCSLFTCLHSIFCSYFFPKSVSYHLLLHVMLQRRFPPSEKNTQNIAAISVDLGEILRLLSKKKDEKEAPKKVLFFLLFYLSS